MRPRLDQQGSRTFRFLAGTGAMGFGAAHLRAGEERRPCRHHRLMVRVPDAGIDLSGFEESMVAVT
jgi:hypothetical protein